MASLGLSQEELKSVEQVRQRLSQLSSSILSLKTDIITSNPLPQPSSLQASTQILQQNLDSLLTVLNENAELFQRLAMHPSANFPGRTQENVLMQLLRKKLEPNVEEWVERGREAAAEATPEGINAMEVMWADMREWCLERTKAYIIEEANDVYTAEERAAGVETVKTGLRRNLDEESDEEEEEEEDEDEDDDIVMLDGPPKPAAPAVATAPAAPRGPEPELMFWYGEIGDAQMPKTVDVESKRAKGPKGLPGMPN